MTDERKPLEHISTVELLTRYRSIQVKRGTKFQSSYLEMNALLDEAARRDAALAAAQAQIEELQAENDRLRKEGCYPMRPIVSGSIVAEWNTPEEDQAWEHFLDEGATDDE